MLMKMLWLVTESTSVQIYDYVAIQNDDDYKGIANNGINTAELVS